MDANPINLVDKFGLKTTLITIRDYGFGTHSAVHIDQGTAGAPELYDPAGSYLPKSGTPPGSGDMHFGKDANLKDYIRYHENLGSKVEITVLQTTPAQEREISKRIDKRGGAFPFACTRAVVDVLGGVCGIKSPALSLPGLLQDKVKKARCKKK